MSSVTENITARQHYEIGYLLYEAGHALSTCANAFQRGGWWAALKADAECNTPAYASKMGF
jgi:hypothetical protein